MAAEHSSGRDPDESIEPLYGSRYALAPIPKHRLPAGEMPAATDMTVLRVVVRESFNRDMADLLAADLTSVLAELDARPPGDHDHQPKTRGVR
jgi:hypothetical protein